MFSHGPPRFSCMSGIPFCYLLVHICIFNKGIICNYSNTTETLLTTKLFSLLSEMGLNLIIANSHY